MPDRLTEDELADRCGINREDVRKLVDLGILQSDEGTFARRDVMRVRVVSQLEAMGMEAEAIAAALESGHLTLGYLESSGRRPPRSERTFTEIGEEMGVELATLERIYVAFGLPQPGPDERVREEDLEIIRVLPLLLGAGVDEGDVLRLARVWGDSARRVAQYLPHYFHTTVEKGSGGGPPRQRGVRGGGPRGRRSGGTIR
jgi:hypothetical protein